MQTIIRLCWLIFACCAAGMRHVGLLQIAVGCAFGWTLGGLINERIAKG